MPDRLPDPSDSLGALLSDSTRLLRRRFDQRARVFGLSRAQWDVLKHLHRNDGIALSGLADLLEIEPVSLCREIGRMEEAGWIERRAGPGEDRPRHLFLSAKSLQVMERARGIAEDLYAEALAGLSPDRVELLTDALRTLRDNLSHRRAA